MNGGSCAGGINGRSCRGMLVRTGTHDNALSKVSNALTTFNQRASDVTRKS